MYDVITIGSALVDIFVKSSQYTLKNTKRGMMLCQLYDQKIDVDSFTVATGGAGGNTAVGFSRAGFMTAVVSETGKDVFSQVVLDELRRDCVHTKFVAQERQEQTGGSVILVGADGGRTVLVNRGASSMLDPHDIPARALKRARWVHLSSIGGRLFTLKHIANIIRETDIRCSWNPGSAELDLLASGALDPTALPCQVLLVNKDEWASIQSVQATLRSHVSEIVITEGKKGGKIYLQGERRAARFKSSGAKTVEETGAGDAFAVGYVVARLHDRSPMDAVTIGSKNAGAVVQQVGAKAGLLHRDQLLG